MLFNSTTENKFYPADIRKLFSIPGKGNSAPSWTKKIVNKSEIKINSKIYQEVGKHVIYCLSKVSHSSLDSLVDRRANSGVAGNDVRVIAKNPNRTADFVA